jgi:hypothetical protein
MRENTPLHRVASTAKWKGSEVRFRGVVSVERYMTFYIVEIEIR